MNTRDQAGDKVDTGLSRDIDSRANVEEIYARLGYRGAKPDIKGIPSPSNFNQPNRTRPKNTHWHLIISLIACNRAKKSWL